MRYPLSFGIHPGLLGWFVFLFFPQFSYSHMSFNIKTHFLLPEGLSAPLQCAFEPHMTPNWAAINQIHNVRPHSVWYNSAVPLPYPQGHLFVAVVWKSRNLQFSATNRDIISFPRQIAKFHASVSLNFDRWICSRGI